MKQYLGDEADSQDLKVFYKLGTLAFLLVSVIFSSWVRHSQPG